VAKPIGSRADPRRARVRSIPEPAGKFAVPPTLEVALERLRAYWDGLKRGGNAIPFWDDVKLSALADAGAGALLIDAFADPTRFRLNTVGGEVAARYGHAVTGKFCDQIAATSPFDLITAQCAATVTSRAPTYSRHAGQPSYGRLILPLWGNGRIDMLLAGIAG
jgi:hypothetical protein